MSYEVYRVKRRVLKERIYTLREHFGDTQRDFADRVGLPSSSINRYESGSYIMNADTLLRICISTGCSADYLLGLSEEPFREGDQHG